MRSALTVVTPLIVAEHSATRRADAATVVPKVREAVAGRSPMRFEPTVVAADTLAAATRTRVKLEVLAATMATDAVTARVRDREAVTVTVLATVAAAARLAPALPVTWVAAVSAAVLLAQRVAVAETEVAVVTATARRAVTAGVALRVVATAIAPEAGRPPRTSDVKVETIVREALRNRRPPAVAAVVVVADNAAAAGRRGVALAETAERAARPAVVAATRLPDALIAVRAVMVEPRRAVTAGTAAMLVVAAIEAAAGRPPIAVAYTLAITVSVPLRRRFAPAVGVTLLAIESAALRGLSATTAVVMVVVAGSAALTNRVRLAVAATALTTDTAPDGRTMACAWIAVLVTKANVTWRL